MTLDFLIEKKYQNGINYKCIIYLVYVILCTWLQYDLNISHKVEIKKHICFIIPLTENFEGKIIYIPSVEMLKGYHFQM